MSIEELRTILKYYPDQNNVIACTELIYLNESQKSEELYNPEIFKLNNW